MEEMFYEVRKEVEMGIMKRSRTTATAVALLLGWLVLAVSPAAAQMTDFSWCLAEHNGEFNDNSVIWPGTGTTGGYALVTVTSGGATGANVPKYPFTVNWRDSRGLHTERLASTSSVTVWAQWVEVVHTVEKEPKYSISGEYTITFNLCDCYMRAGP